MSLINKEKMMEEIRAGFEAMDIIGKMPTVNAIPLDKVKQAREESIEKVCMFSGSGNEITQAYCDGLKAGLEILDKLMEGVEDESKESKQTNIAC